VYLFNELHYSQEKYSALTMVGFPISLLGAFISSRYFSKNYIKTIFWFLVIEILIDLFTINVLFYFSFSELTFDVLLFFS